MKKSFAILASLGLAFAVVSLALADQDKTPKYTVEEIMKALHKGDDSVGKKVLKGQGKQADFDKLVEYYTSLPLNDPPQGDPEGWKQKTTAVLNAAQALKDGKPGALDQYTKAVSCKDCHSIYRPVD
jgi:hypothetical protein